MHAPPCRRGTFRPAHHQTIVPNVLGYTSLRVAMYCKGVSTPGHHVRVMRANALRACSLLVIAAATLTILFVPRSARADDRGSATVGKITVLNRKAVDAYQHLEFETAMRLLNEALDRAERAGLNQHPIRARTYVTLGIVTLGGFKQRE